MKTDKNMIYYSVTSYGIGESRLPIYGVKRQLTVSGRNGHPTAAEIKTLPF